MKDYGQPMKACLSAFLMNIAGHGFQQAHVTDGPKATAKCS